MKTRIGTLAVLTAVLACTPAYAASTKVKVRVEGATKTIFEGTVKTTVHDVKGDDGVAHKCDGTNGAANPTPGPTATGSLDTAASAANFGLSAGWNDSFQDFQIDKVGPDAATSSKFWGVAVDGKSLEVGGCQFEVKTGDEVLWAYDMFNKKHLLLLHGTTKVRAGRRFAVKVLDGATGDPLAGARVGGKKTNASGIVRLRYSKPGVKRLKATRSDSVRSNQLRVKVLRRR